MKTMEATIHSSEVEVTETTAEAELQALTELNANDLALVGGGMVNVSFY
jgi:hypothetical protein